jgi:hypothetical protein
MTAGDYRKQDLLPAPKDGLPDSFDVFHGLGWSVMHDHQQQFYQCRLLKMGRLPLQELRLNVKASYSI